MAERRMFAKSVIQSARFIRMPPSSRLLYYDLGMAADDDGVVEAFTVMRLTDATEDDLRILVSKGFVTILNEDLVTYILDWNRNNLIKKDRYTPSIYRELLLKIEDGTQVEPSWNPNGTQAEPQVRLGKESIGKSSIGEDREGNGGADAPPARTQFSAPSLEEVTAYCKERGNQVDPQRWLDYYTANGWKVGKNPMRDWRASVRTWERNETVTPSKQAGKEPLTPQTADEQRDDIQWLQSFMAVHGGESWARTD